MQNYEIEFESEIMRGLSEKFQLDTEQLYIYLYLRYAILHSKKMDHFLESFTKFALEELCVFGNEIKFFPKAINKEDTVHDEIDDECVVFKQFGYENAIWNVNESITWPIRQYVNSNLQTHNTHAETCWNDIERYVQKMRRTYSKSQARVSLDQYYGLKKLNELFHVPATPIVPKMNCFVQNDLITTEELLKRYEQAHVFHSDDVQNLTESELQRYLSRNLYLLEDGLTLLGVEYPISDHGFLDIFAQDRDGKYVIVELKVKEDDKRVLWQAVYYKNELSKRLQEQDFCMGKKKTDHGNDIRVCIVAPDFPDYILDPLRTVTNAECYRYTVVTHKNKIEKLKISKI